MKVQVSNLGGYVSTKGGQRDQNTDPYSTVSLKVDQTRIEIKLGKLVAFAHHPEFVWEPNSQMNHMSLDPRDDRSSNLEVASEPNSQMNHMSLDPRDDRSSNLEVASQSENQQHGRENNVHRASQTKRQGDPIRGRLISASGGSGAWVSYDSVGAAATKLGLSRNAVSHHLSGYRLNPRGYEFEKVAVPNLPGKK